ncbi:ATP-binding protein [Sinorhizobium garamanticum]|uniref:ATP-binding protein n=1 Tax=Sinorhizobium garamanticum TaxID=680247 RepID=A0ABY8D6C2_9HYPH|nr:AAA family ATPase [Sinorhizobium garamanticum]WEX86419.1 ATP-binding protein [Sinorhizobium garamanticum]
MKLITVEVEGLLGRTGVVRARFNDDLNIVTGRNGAGKTTFLKLIWYVLSGNISQAVSEIQFNRIDLKTSEYRCEITRINPSTCRAEFTDATGVRRSIEDEYGHEDRPDFVLSDARDVLAELVTPVGSSLFFPTFRRIEGGFTMGGPKGRLGPSSGPSRQLEDAMSGLARRMSNSDHSFVTSISTIDIESLLLKHYADLSEESNRLQQTVSTEMIDVIRRYKSVPLEIAEGETEAIESANHVINSVHQQIEEMETKRKAIMAPMEAIQKLIAQFFQHSGIRFGTRLNFGDAASAINSDSLSAGEKQMLSFICYNAFKRDCIAFIDEPELSLHVDWQRLIFPTLLKQKSGNQFIIATHSPFIYSKYPDKEISIDGSSDRGDNLVVE